VTGLTTILHENIIDKNYKNTSSLIHQSSIDLLYSNYINLLQDADVSSQIKSEIYGIIIQQSKYLEKKIKRTKVSSNYFGFYKYQLQRLENTQLKNLKKSELIQLPKMPPGSPI